MIGRQKVNNYFESKLEETKHDQQNKTPSLSDDSYLDDGVDSNEAEDTQNHKQPISLFNNNDNMNPFAAVVKEFSQTVV